MAKVIKIENLWKQYRLGVIGYGTLRADLQSWWSRMRGREDPNKRILIGPRPQTEETIPDLFWALQEVDLEVEQAEVLGPPELRRRIAAAVRQVAALYPEPAVGVARR